MKTGAAAVAANGAVRPHIERVTLRPTQHSLFDLSPPPGPEGWAYRAGLISTDEEDALVRTIAELPFAPFDFQGFRGNRRIVSFGGRYDFSAGRLLQADPLPAFLEPLRAKAAEFAGLAPADLRQILVTEYAPGAGIGWHRDRPQFDKVVGVSLGSACVLRFRRKTGERWERTAAALAPRSAYLLDGPARTDWQHSITPGAELRYSVTFRSLRG